MGSSTGAKKGLVDAQIRRAGTALTLYAAAGLYSLSTTDSPACILTLGGIQDSPNKKSPSYIAVKGTRNGWF
jgi:hypothetical protein